MLIYIYTNKLKEKHGKISPKILLLKKNSRKAWDLIKKVNYTGPLLDTLTH